MSDEAAPLAVVVGGGSGIGAAVVAAYRSQGTETVTWDIAGDRDLTCDVTEPDAIDRAVAETTQRFGLPRWVTVTAGVGHSGMLLDEAPENFDRVMAVNARGPWLCLRGWARVLRDEGRQGSLIAVSSISARLADRAMGVYCASKAALSMLVRVAAAEWAPFDLRVNAVAPGATITPMLGLGPAPDIERSPWLSGMVERTALGRLGEPDDVAQVVLGVHEMEWLTGQVLEADGGLSLWSPINAYGGT